MKKLILIIFALAMTLAVFADAYTIGTGTSTESYIPFYGLYDYGWSKTIHTSTEMIAAGMPAAGTTITGVSYYVGNTPSNYVAVDQRVYVRGTTATAIDLTYIADPLAEAVPFTAAYIGDLTWNGGGWHNITFTTPFVWNGTDNVEIYWQNWDGVYASGPSFRYTTTASYLACYRYADGSMPTTAATQTYSRPNIRFLDALASIPGPPSLLLPADLATGVIVPPTFSWSAPSQGGIPTSYKLYLNQGSPTFGAPVYEGPNTSFTYPTALTYSATYYWKVAASNTAGDTDSPVWSFTTMNDPTVSPDYQVDFSTWPVTNWSQLNYVIGGTPATGGSWSQDDWLNITTPVNKAAKINIYYTHNSWLVTPPVAVPAGTYEVKFDLAFMVWNSLSTAVTAGNQADDRLLLVMADNSTMTANPVILREWNNTSSSFVLDNILPAGETHVIPLTGVVGTKYFAFYAESLLDDTGDNDLMVDNFYVRQTPTTGVLTVTPNPVECGNSFLGVPKSVTVSLSNTGVSPFTVVANGISLSSYTNFQLANLPTLPLTINPTDPPVTFNVIFNPTVTGPLTTNLLINDTRLNSSIVVNGTGVVMPVGEICENPYLATLPLVDYAGTTAGYANDYTSAMFTGLTSTSYVGGKDWVAKITIPSAGMLDISLADQAGYSSQYMGVFLVNTIPSLGSPAAVLAQASASSGTITITDAVVTAGDYYVIVDNWPSPYDIYFVLNIAFEATSAPPNPAVLVSPLDNAINVPLTQTLNWSSGGGLVEGYRLSFGTVAPYAVIVDNVNLNMLTTYAPVLAYSTEYWWKVTPYNVAFGDASPITEWSFTTRGDPTKPLPYVQNFDSGTSLALIDWTGDMYIYSAHGTAGTNGLTRNLYSSIPTTYAVTPPIGPMTNGVVLTFDYRIVNWSGYPSTATVLGTSDNVQVQISTDSGVTYNTIHTINQANHVTSTNFALVTVPLTAYTTGNIMLKYLGIWGSGDYYLDIDNVVVWVPPSGPVLPPNLVYPVQGQGLMPIEGFPFQFSWNMAGSQPETYTLYVSNTDVSEDDFFANSYPFYDVTSPFTPTGIPYAYDQHWFWTVSGANTQYPAEVYTWPPYEYIMEPDPTIDVFCYTQDFETWPPFGWDLTGGTYSFAQYTGVTGNHWAYANFWGQSAGNTDIMTTPPIFSATPLTLSFLWSHQYNSSYPNDALTVEISTNQTDWVPIWYKGATDLNSADGAGSTTPGTGVQASVFIPSQYVNTNFWLRFYGYSGYGPNLFIDDVTLCESLDYDIGPTAITGVPQVVNDQTVIAPVITVTNFGIYAAINWSIDIDWDGIHIHIGNRETILPGSSVQVTVPPFTANAFTFDELTATTIMTLDENAENNVLATTLAALPLNVAAVANDVWNDQYISFNLQTPNVQSILPTAPTYTIFMAGADWKGTDWIGVEYDDGTLVSDTYNDIDAITGATTYIGDLGVDLNGIAYDATHGIMYGTDGSNLYTLNALGAATLVGAHNNVYNAVNGLMIDIAYDNANNILYGIDLFLDCLWIINPATGNCGTLVGFLGIDINYAQDAAFDQDNGCLYLAGYNYTTSAPGLYWIDTTGGGAYLVGPLTSETTAFAIPYGSTAAAPDIDIDQTGIVSWTAVPNAVAYNIYASDDPYGEFVWVATTPNTSWLDPNFSEPMKFYYVKSVGGRTTGSTQRVWNYNTVIRKPAPSLFTEPKIGEAPRIPVK